MIPSTSALFSQTPIRPGPQIPITGSTPVLAPSPKPALNKSPGKAATVYIPELKIPKDAMREYRLGSTRYAEGNYIQAEHHFSMAGSLYPKFSSAFGAQAMALMKLNRYDEAHRAVNKALNLNRNNLDCIRVLGIIYFHESKYEEAEVQFKRVLAAYPHDSRSRLMLVGIAIFRNDPTEVLRQTDEIESKDAEQFPVAYMARAEALEKLGETREAVGCYEKYIKAAGSSGESFGRAQAAITRLSGVSDQRDIQPAN